MPRAPLLPLALIAEGAQGRVYLAADVELGRFVAVKLLRLAGDPAAAAASLMREAAPFLRALADAPCLVLLGAGRVSEADGRLAAFAEAKEGERYFYLEMPYIHGPNLRELGLAAGALRTEEVAGVVGALARKLEKLHAGGESHLDLKPENALVEAHPAAGGIFLTDFHMGTRAGSLGYAAPEQGEKPGPACDVYALSRLALELWAGKLPARGAPPSKLAPEPPPLPDEAPEELRALHRDLVRLLRAGVDSSPNARPSMAELAARTAGFDVAVRQLVGRAPATERFTELHAIVAKGVPGKSGADPVRPSTALGANGESTRGGSGTGTRGGSGTGTRGGSGTGTRSNLAWTLGTLAVLAASAGGYGWYERLHPAYVNPLPSIPAPASRPPADCRVSAPAKAIRSDDEALPSDAIFQQTIEAPVARVSLSVLWGPELLVMPDPNPRDFCKISLPPGTYHVEVDYEPNAFGYDDIVTLRAGRAWNEPTRALGQRAPVLNPHKDERLVNPLFGPMQLVMGPASIDNAVWDSDAGTLGIAGHLDHCQNPTGALSFGPQGRGPAEPPFHLASGEMLCAYANPDAKAGFALTVNYTEEELPP